MSEWGRKEYPSWPSRRSLWTWGAFFFALAFFVGGMAWQYQTEWTFLQRYYLPMYGKTWVRGDLLPTNKARYQLLDAVDAKGRKRTAVGGEVEQVTDADGRIEYVPTDADGRTARSNSGGMTGCSTMGSCTPIWGTGSIGTGRRGTT